MSDEIKEQIIHVGPDDEIATIRDKLAWADAPRVILVVPRRNRALRDKMNLKLVQRTAIDQAVRLALVAHHRDTVRLAQEIGLPVFWTKKSLLGEQRWSGALEPTFVQDEHADELKVIAPAEPRVSRSYRLVGMGTLALLVGLILMITVLLIPTARITLSPVSEETAVKVEITASASQKTVNTLLAQIPARFDEIPLEGAEQVTPAVKKDVPDARASGVVVFTSKTDQALRIPKGSLVSTSGGVPIRFASTADADLPPRGRVEVNVAAVEPGLAGNVAKFTINTADGPFALAVNVVNSNNMAGGTVKRVPVVGEDDKRRAAEALIRRLQREAVARFQATLVENEFVPPETITVTLETRTFDRLVDEPADTLTLSAHATARGLVVNGANANIVALERLRSKVRTSFELLPDSIQFLPGSVLATGADSARFELTAKGRSATTIDRVLIANSVRGMTVSQSLEWLNNHLTLRKDPLVELKSDILGLARLPYFTFRMQVEVVP